MNDNVLLLIFSLPYVYDFIVGIVSLIFMSRIAYFNETLKEIMMNENEEERKRFLESRAEGIKKKFSGENISSVLEKRRNMKYLFFY